MILWQDSNVSTDYLETFNTNTSDSSDETNSNTDVNFTPGSSSATALSDSVSQLVLNTDSGNNENPREVSGAPS